MCVAAVRISVRNRSRLRITASSGNCCKGYVCSSGLTADLSSLLVYPLPAGRTDRRERPSLPRSLSLSLSGRIATGASISGDFGGCAHSGSDFAPRRSFHDVTQLHEARSDRAKLSQIVLQSRLGLPFLCVCKVPEYLLMGGER